MGDFCRKTLDIRFVSLDWLVCGRGTMFYGDPGKKAKTDELNREIDEMLELIEKLPLARHLILGYFQKFKVDYNDVIQKELGKIKSRENENTI